MTHRFLVSLTALAAMSVPSAPRPAAFAERQKLRSCRVLLTDTRTCRESGPTRHSRPWSVRRGWPQNRRSRTRKQPPMKSKDSQREIWIGGTGMPKRTSPAPTMICFTTVDRNSPGTP